MTREFVLTDMEEGTQGRYHKSFQCIDVLSKLKHWRHNAGDCVSLQAGLSQIDDHGSGVS